MIRTDHSTLSEFTSRLPARKCCQGEETINKFILKTKSYSEPVERSLFHVFNHLYNLNLPANPSALNKTTFFFNFQKQNP